MKRRAVLLIALAVVATGCAKSGGRGAATGTVDNKVSPRVARIYFESASMLLMAEPHNLQLPQNPAAAIPIIAREVLKGPSNPALMRSFPADTVVLGCYVLPDGTVFLDLGGPTLSRGWGAGSHEELMAAYSLVQTVTVNFPEVKRIRLLVNGVTAETLAGHLALDRSLRADAALVDTRSR